MKKRFLLPLIAFCIIGMTGCDKTVDTSSEEVASIASSVVEGDSKDVTFEVSSEVIEELGFTDDDIEYTDSSTIVISLNEDKTAIDTIEYDYYVFDDDTYELSIETANLTFSVVGTTTNALDFSTLVAYSYTYFIQ